MFVVGRSTFYMHFRDKDDLLASSIQEMLHAMPASEPRVVLRPKERLVSFSLPLFAHIQAHHRQAGAVMTASGRAALHTHLEQTLAHFICSNMGRLGLSKRETRVSPDLLIQHAACTFILVLSWWLEGNRDLPSKEVNEVFLALILPALEAAWD